MDLRPPRWTPALLALLAVWLLIAGSAIGPSSSTETRYCEMGREMAVSRDWIVPTFNGAPLLEKPPLVYWGTSTAFRWFGIGDMAARVPQLLVAALVLLVVFLVAARLAPEGTEGKWRGTLAVVALGTMPSFVLQAYVISPDIWLLLSTTLGGWALLEADRAPGRAPRRWPLLLHTALGLGMLAKGPLTLGLLLGAAIATALVRRRARILRPFADPFGLLLFLAISLPWYLVLDARLPGQLASLVKRRLFGGLASASDFHSHGPWTVWLPLLGTFPWAALLQGSIRRIASRERWRDGLGLPIVAFSLAAPVLFTFSASRLASYASPAYPWIAVLLALGAPAVGAGDTEPGARPHEMELGTATIGMALVTALLGAGAVVAALGIVHWVAVPLRLALLAVAAGVGALALALWPRPSAVFARPVPRTVGVVLVFFLAAGCLASAAPASVGSARALYEALKRHRTPGEPVAVALNYNGDWGLLPWYSRGEVLFFGYPSDPMMVAPEKHRPDLFRPRAELVAWLGGPGRRWLMARPRDLKPLRDEGASLSVVASVHEYVLVATQPLDTRGPP